jgi:hypothetical protein
MRLEAGFIRLPMHEFLGAADAADQKKAEQLLVAVVRLGPSGRTCSRRVPERMAERVAGGLPWDGEHEQARGAAVSYDDLRVVGVPVPLERDHITSVLACVELHEHDWLLSGFRLRRDGNGT